MLLAPSATTQQKEDDTAILASNVGWVPSRFGNSFATATPLQFILSSDGNTATATAAGVVAQAGVSDFFRFNGTKGTTATFTGQVIIRLVNRPAASALATAAFLYHLLLTALSVQGVHSTHDGPVVGPMGLRCFNVAD